MMNYFRNTEEFHIDFMVRGHLECYGFLFLFNCFITNLWSDAINDEILLL